MFSVSELQQQQRRIVSAIHGTVALRGADDPAIDALAADYSGSVQQLEATLGSDAHCYDVDSVLWEAYRMAFKEQHGVEPVQVTLDQARAFIMSSAPTTSQV